MDALLIAVLVFSCGLLIAKAMQRHRARRGQSQPVAAKIMPRGPVLIESFFSLTVELRDGLTREFQIGGAEVVQQLVGAARPDDGVNGG